MVQRAARVFVERDGRRQAAFNLVQNGIEALVIIGGDGSLTGAHILQQEWSGLLAELVAAGQISAEMADTLPIIDDCRSGRFN